MRHLTARARADGSGWHYVSASRRGGHPLGYCADHEPHVDEAGARECYARWQRDHIRLNQGPTSWSNCYARSIEDPSKRARCPNPANQYADIEGDGYRAASLCPEHMTFDHAVDALDLRGPAGDAWES